MWMHKLYIKDDDVFNYAYKPDSRRHIKQHLDGWCNSVTR